MKTDLLYFSATVDTKTEWLICYFKCFVTSKFMKPKTVKLNSGMQVIKHLIIKGNTQWISEKTIGKGVGIYTLKRRIWTKP